MQGETGKNKCQARVRNMVKVKVCPHAVGMKKNMLKAWVILCHTLTLTLTWHMIFIFQTIFFGHFSMMLDTFAVVGWMSENKIKGHGLGE